MQVIEFIDIKMKNNWTIAKIVSHDVAEAWYKNLVGKKIRIYNDDNGKPLCAYLLNYKYYYEYSTRNLINAEDVVIEK